MTEVPSPQNQPHLSGHFIARVTAVLRSIWRRIENIVFGVVLTLIILYFVLQSSLVQNWLIGKITGYLSEELHTRVEVRHVDISFFDNLVLEGFYVADLKGDTLLYARSLKAGLNSNIFTLLRNKLEFNEISLSQARFNIRRAEGEYDNNLQFVLDYFAGDPNKPRKEPAPFHIRIQNLRLSDVQFLMDDQVRGQRMAAGIRSANIRVNDLDLGKNLFDIQSVHLDGPSFSIAEYPAKPLSGRVGERPAARPVSTQIDTFAQPRPARPLRLKIGNLVLREGFFSLDRFDVSPARTTAPEVMDYNHLAVREIHLNADSVTADDDLAFSGVLRHLSAREQCGFVIEDLHAGKVTVNDSIAALYQMELRTPGTVLGDTMALRYGTYRDFNKFTDRVRLDGRFKPGSHVQLSDIMVFSPAVAENTFFTQNRAEKLALSGAIDGSINRLNGRDLEIRLNENTFIKGDFDGDDMAEGSDRMRLSFDLKQARSDVRTIRQIIPGFNAPEYFNRLGRVNFQGTYLILFGSNHILTGNLNTDIGYGNLDMQLDLTGGAEKAVYSGFLNMNDFDLQQWTGSSEFGKSTFKVNIAKSTGLTLRTINAQLTGVVDSFYFRGYNYRNVEMNGRFNKAVFQGFMNIEDPNIDFTFDGTVNLKDTTEYDFKADLRRLDLGALNLVPEDWVLSGKINKIQLYARNLNDLRGTVILRDFRLIQDKQYVHRIDSLTFAALNRPNGERYFILLSDIVNGILEGRFELNRMGANLHRIFYSNYPALVGQAFGKPPESDTLPLTDLYKFNIQIKNTRALTRLIDPELDTISGAWVRGNVNAPQKSSELRFYVPKLAYNGLTIRETNFAWTNTPEKGTYDLSVPQALLANGQQLAQIHFFGEALNDQIGFTLNTEDTASIVQRVNLNGALSTFDSLWQLHFNTSDITLFDEQWLMDEENYLRFSGSYFDARNFDLMNGLQRITVDPFNEGRGVLVSLANLDLNILQKFLNPEGINFRGKIYNIDIELYDLFQLRDFRGYVTTDTIFVNEKPYGKLFANVELPDLDSALWWRLFLKDNEKHQLRVLGAWAQDNAIEHTFDELGVVRPGDFQTKISANNFPLEVLQLFVPGISKTSGKINAAAIYLGGPFNRIGMSGVAEIDGQFQMDYLKALFYVPNQTIRLTNYQLWADSVTILDAGRHAALVQGGLRHDHFSDWRIDCRIKSVGNDFMMLNTLSTDNELFYGQGIGSFDARFSGSFSKTNISVTAVTGKDTRLYIPLGSTSDIEAVSFIRFKEKTTSEAQDKTKSSVLEDIKGLNLEMNLTITDEAEVQLIFDEKAGDIVKGRGEGNIQMAINREGEFKMYGDYRIRRGEYLFTLLNWVNKPFTVAEGGTISWFGDPYSAQISLDATYEENASLYNLLRDELALTNNLNAEATKSTKVVVTMHLKGDLFKPSISFDLGFPNVSPQSKSLIDSKLSQLRQDQNELTRQVFGLIVVGSFLPPSSGSAVLQSGDYLASAFNTLTQVLSNQLSGYLTSLATEWFGGTVSSINFDIAYNEYRNQVNPGQTNLTQIGRELQVRLTSGFANDRITIQVGSQFGLGQVGTTTNDGFLGEDVVVEIQLTENRQWRLKVYQRTEPDIAGGSRRSRYGFGINFRRDYETFGELLNDLTGWMKRK